MTTAVVLIGNSDDKLTQALWVSFQSETADAVEEHAKEIHFGGHSHVDDEWQTACWVIEIDGPRLPSLRARLSHLAWTYGQDSIAVSLGDTEFVIPPALTLGYTEFVTPSEEIS